jgi:hypothetical protein
MLIDIIFLHEIEQKSSYNTFKWDGKEVEGERRWE